MSDNNSNQNDDPSLFSYDEMRYIVKGFLIAYMDNKLQVDFLAHAKCTVGDDGLKRYPEEDVKNESNWKAGLQDSIDIVTKSKPATDDEIRQTVKTIFSDIITYRMNGWVNGSFYDFTLERKLSDLEKKYYDHDKTINEYVKHLKEQSGI